MTDEEFRQLMELPHELRGVEFKSPGPLSNNRLVAQVVKAVLAMANRRHGGLVVIGVEESGSEYNWIGLSESELNTWNFDHVSDRIGAYADPSVSFDLEIRENDGKKFVLLQVEEFIDIPVLCRRSYDDVLREGACYVRSRRKPESTDVPTQADMRDLLELAIEKGVRRFLAQAHSVGLIVPPTSDPSSSDQDRFDQQLGDLK